jgi:hypothetical protein
MNAKEIFGLILDAGEISDSFVGVAGLFVNILEFVCVLF